MSDELPTIWDAEPHTTAKHAILEGYLKAWMAILARQTAKLGLKKPILYIDGFAGPGIYTGGEEGSPVVAIRTAIEHSHELPVAIRVLCIEQRGDRYRRLAEVLEDQRQRAVGSSRVIIDQPIQGDCYEEISRLLDHYDHTKARFGPALVFLDQFGYSAVPMDLIRRVMGHDVCEVLTYLNWSHLGRFITDETKWGGITRAFGGEEWKEVLDLPVERRSDKLLQLYKQTLVDRGGARFHCSFSMHDERRELLYWLFFCSQNIRGLEEMKRSMWRVDETGEFRFYDRHFGQLRLLQGYDDEWLADALCHDLRGATRTVADVRKHVLLETPCWRYLGALQILEKQKCLSLLDAPPSRLRGSFGKYQGMRIRFDCPPVRQEDQQKLF